jgi:hypothetical protein
VRESLGSTKPKGGMKVKAPSKGAAEVGSRPPAGWAHHRPARTPRPSSLGRGIPTVGRSKSVHVGTRKMVNYA